MRHQAPGRKIIPTRYQVIKKRSVGGSLLFSVMIQSLVQSARKGRSLGSKATHNSSCTLSSEGASLPGRRVEAEGGLC